MAIAVAVTIATSAVFLTGAHGSPPPTSNTGTGTSTTATTGTTTTTSRSLPTAIANDGWSGTAGPLTVTVTHLARIGTSLELKLEAQTTSALTLPFYGSFAATSPSGQTFTFAASKDPLQLIPGTAVAATVQLSGVDPLPAKLTVAFSHIYPTDPNELPAVSNGLLVHDIPIPQ